MYKNCHLYGPVIKVCANNLTEEFDDYSRSLHERSSKPGHHHEGRRRRRLSEFVSPIKRSEAFLVVVVASVGTIQYRFAMRRGAAGEGPSLPTIRCSAYRVQRDRVGNGSGTSAVIKAGDRLHNLCILDFLSLNFAIQKVRRGSSSHVGERGHHTIPICAEERGGQSLPTIRCSTYRVTAR